MKRIAFFTIIVFLALGLTPSAAQSASESYVIGRMTGTLREFPGYFHNSNQLHEQGINNVEFPGFRLLRVKDGKRFLIRPNRNGFFFQSLPGGEYSLTRKRNDRPGYKEPKTIDILNFTVERRTLVNLGTINIVLDGKPHESLWWSQNATKGTYTYRYHYERDPGDHAYDDPFNWFMRRKSKIAVSFGDRVSVVDTSPTLEKDGSKVVLREGNPRFNR